MKQAMFLIAGLLVLFPLSSAATAPPRSPPPPTPPCQSACMSDYYKCINSQSICDQQRDACLRGCS
ncbi:hypothetical protein EC957_001975 [Mortierella hygrophila]|uniref:Uncharacterized protein n=1 Tax=Mortierella hygrophila TaxID=979708 RepID=A0A9P6K1Y0_9FUNG|nr:hypothetical protein EC957_001975 [Mortierella hygrophila]